MKYIKKYEAKREYKKFLIIQNSRIYKYDYHEKYDYYIVKYINKFNIDSMIIDFKFGYTDEHNFNYLHEKHYYINLNDTTILYQSDKLKDCIDRLSLITQLNKYNI